MTGSVQYFGYFCHGLASGDPCTVETTEYVTVAGVCTEIGHCVTHQRGVRFRHLSCLNNADMDREEGMDMGMNMKKIHLLTWSNMLIETEVLLGRKPLM